jgi:hypothetical protein
MPLNRRRIASLREHVPKLYQQYQAQVPWLTGVGIGEKTVAGKPTGEESILFFVGRKMPTEALRPEHTLPKSIPHPRSRSGRQVATDVVRIGPFQLLQSCNCFAQLPLYGGNCVAPLGSYEQGTNGGLVMDPSTGKIYIVSNAHVLTPYNRYPIGHEIVQPGGSTNVVAVLSRATTMAPNIPIKSDAAIAECIDPTDVSFDIASIGAPAGIGAPSSSLRVTKSGQTSGLTSGTIQALHVTQAVGPFTYQDCFLATLPSGKGDSGSFVLDDEGMIVGLVCAGPDTSGLGASLCSDINNVITEMGIEGWQWVPKS